MSATPIDPAVRSAVAATASVLAADSAVGGSALLEKDLEQRFIPTLKRCLDEAQIPAQVSGQHPVRWQQWPGVGRVDIRASAESWTALFELKWGRGTLYNCIWDLPKMAAAAALRESTYALLLAGAPAADWRGAHGSEFFCDKMWDPSSLFNERYSTYWLKWASDVKTRPLRIPVAIETRLLVNAPLTILEEPWELRCIQSTAAAEWCDVPPLPTGDVDL